MSETRVKVEDGKYEFIIPEGDWRIHVLRYGEDWLWIEAAHKAVSALLFEFESFQQALEAANDKIALLEPFVQVLLEGDDQEYLHAYDKLANGLAAEKRIAQLEGDTCIQLDTITRLRADHETDAKRIADLEAKLAKCREALDVEGDIHSDGSRDCAGDRVGCDDEVGKELGWQTP